MAQPVLRQPKTVLGLENPNESLPFAKDYVLITLKGERKMVITKDSYNGILSAGGFYKCVFCGTLLELKQAAKDNHIRSVNHGKTLEKYPHVDEFSYNLIRKLTNESTYCTICNVVVENVKLHTHVQSAIHLQELERAEARALTYKSYN